MAIEGSNKLADQHAKRLKVAKSSRVTLGAPESLKPPRFGVAKRGGASNNPMSDVDLSLSYKGNNLQIESAKALLPQSLKDNNLGAEELPYENQDPKTMASAVAPGQPRQPYQQPFFAPQKDAISGSAMGGNVPIPEVV